MTDTASVSVTNTRLWNQQENNLLAELKREALHALRSCFDGWGRPLPTPPENVLIIDKEFTLIGKRLHDIEVSNEDIALKIKGTESLLEQISSLEKFSTISIVDDLKKATRDGTLSYAPKDYNAVKESLRLEIQYSLKSFLQEALMVLETASKKLQSQDGQENKEKLAKVSTKITDYRERLNALTDLPKRH